MSKILTIEKAINYAKRFRAQGKTIVLAGGCFDVLHQGHKIFLKQAKEKGDVLFVMLESDERIKSIKGKGRPINTQSQRAEALSDLPEIDYIIMLPILRNNTDYDEMISALKPAIIATTKGDPYRFHKERQADHIGALVCDVTDRIPEYSTSQLIEDK
ncbi:MAG: adenylyltransferase/cytidyltransferase family protein [Candidatus Levybacteria bacterium]|nr:adenylyltransferase/cytidyltransferase family protein [Candidatus Levybacteria bacterium]